MLVPPVLLFALLVVYWVGWVCVLGGLVGAEGFVGIWWCAGWWVAPWVGCLLGFVDGSCCQCGLVVVRGWGLVCRVQWVVWFAGVGVTGWQQCRWLQLEQAESVVSLVATLSGQNLTFVHDLYKRKATCEYSFGFLFSPSGMATHSYATRLARLTRLFGLSLPAANQLPAAVLRKAPPNSDDS